MAFVLVQHLAPDHDSLLCELIQRFTTMPVCEAQNGMRVKPNCVYIIPPKYNMAFAHGSLQLFESTMPREEQLPIDFFFQSLANDLHEYAIGIVLSGMGSDGTQGVRAIKAAGGIAVVQRPESAEFDSMPTHAIATNLADFILAPPQMLKQLIAYIARLTHTQFQPATYQTPATENALNKIFTLLRTRTGHDFSQYKPNTIQRRIARRMAVQQINVLDDYVNFLQLPEPEIDTLFSDLLIGVTNFFRDADAYLAFITLVIPTIFANKPSDGLIRAWCAGCSTGEEGYSIAILLCEYMEATKKNHSVQIFATDINSGAIAIARAGLYPLSIAQDISAERLGRFFTLVPDGSAYRVHKNIRDMLIFSEQNVIKDPPFSKLDLISCRNLMIYFNSNLQKKIIPLFHYALNPNGILFLGNSEGIGDFGNLFTVLDRGAKIYQRKEYVAVMPHFTLQRATNTELSRHAILRQRDPHKMTISIKLPLRELTEQTLLRQLAVCGALINNDGDILYLHGSTGLYLEPTAGETGVSNILKMAREGLRRDLTSALHKAIVNKHATHCANVKVTTNGHLSLLNLTVCPATLVAEVAPQQNFWLVILEPVPETQGIKIATEVAGQLSHPNPEVQISLLQQELLSKDNYLEAILEELQTSNEELKFSNEEMQSVNEELQSTNEELETSREELQSLNEELATINNELQIKVGDLSQTNNDMNNLLAGTGIATVFVNSQLEIIRFTPTMAQIINLIPGDIGRPVGHIISNLKDYNLLVPDVQSVLDTLAPIEAELQTITGAWFTMRIRPYRTLSNIIEGAVITFVDINERKRTEMALFESEQRYHSLVSALSEGIVAHGRDGAITMWNHSAEKILGLTGGQIQGLVELDPSWHTIHEDGSAFPPETHPSNKVLLTGEAQANIVMGIHRPDASLTWLSINAVPMFNTTDPSPASVVVSFMDITERKKTEAILHKANELMRLAVVVRDAHDAITVQNLDGHTIAWNPGAVRMYGWSEEEALLMNVSARIPQTLRKEALVKVYELSRAEILEPYCTQRITSSGAVVEVWLTATALLNEGGMMYAIATTERARDTGSNHTIAAAP